MSDFFRNFCIFRVIFATTNKKKKKKENARLIDPTWQVRQPVK